MNSSGPTSRPTVFLLHGLGLAGGLFDAVIDAWGEAIDPVRIDLPGFGGAPALPGVSVSEMADAVVKVVSARAGARWLLVGHSLGGKIATVVAARTLSGEAPLFGLAGVVLLAASPPSPEPMGEDQRAEMTSWALDGPLDAAAARSYVDANVGAPLPPALDDLAVAAVRRAEPEAWLAWMSQGSLEDWSETVGVLDVPALILAGSEDPALGVDAQRRLNGPVYPRARFVELEGARHLLPLERPAEVATAIADFWRTEAGLGPAAPVGFATVLASDRVSARTRSALAARALADDPGFVPTVLTAAQLTTLRAVAARVVPQEASAPASAPASDPASDPAGWIDLAARVEARLARGEGDGWRFADLPPDVEAYRAGLDALTGLGTMTADAQDARLAEVAAGSFTPAAAQQPALSAQQLALWFEDARSDLVQQWLAHPATMAHLGYDGLANGGDGLRKQGFQLLAAGRREAWEPLPVERPPVEHQPGQPRPGEAS